VIEVEQLENKLKICYFVNANNINAQRCMSFCARVGHEVHAISLEQPLQNINSVHYHIIPTNKRLLLFTLPFKLLRFHKIIREVKPSIVDTHYVIKYGFIAALIGFHPLIVTAVGSDILIGGKPALLFRSITRYTLMKADLIICRSRAIKEAIVRLGIEPTKTRIILIGVDSERFRPITWDKSVRKELAMDELDPLVISIRNLSPIYDVETLIKSVPLVLAAVSRTKFIIVGQGKQQSYLQKLAQQLGVLESVIFKGHVSHADIPRYLSSADIYVSTSLSDGTSNSLLEAMACGLAPIVTNIPANQCWIKDDENGYLVPVKDHKALANKIVSLVTNDKLRRSFGEICRKIVMKNAEHQTEMAKTEASYHELISEYSKAKIN